MCGRRRWGWAGAAPRESLFSERLLFICTKLAGALLPKERIWLPRNRQEGEHDGQGGMMAPLTSSHQEESQATTAEPLTRWVTLTSRSYQDQLGW